MRKDKVAIEIVQRRATRLIASLCKLAFFERLKILKLNTLEYKGKRGRMIEVYKISDCVYDVTATEGMFTINERNSRENPCKLLTRKSLTCLESSFFTTAVLNDWNPLSESVIFNVHLNLFESRLDKHWEKSCMISFLE